MRGTPQTYGVATLAPRFIPAYAGNAPPPNPPTYPPPVHPRVCGERVAAVKHGGWLFRFIPAYAGNARINHVVYHLMRGSSPRMRGTHGRAGGSAER